MKSTQQLIELQKSITQGEWTFSLDESQIGQEVWTAHGKPTRVDFVCRATLAADAAAIALAPELIAEVIRLCATLGHCDRLAGCQGSAEDRSLAMGEIRSIARAALAGDK